MQEIIIEVIGYNVEKEGRQQILEDTFEVLDKTPNIRQWLWIAYVCLRCK